MKGKFQRSIIKFMDGRYGPDELYNFQFIFLVILIILDLFVNSNLLWLIEVINMGIMLFRFFSKNVYKRRRENNKYLDIEFKVGRPFRNIMRNYKDKKHIYKNCKCGTTIKIKVPKKRGIVHATCPNCSKRVSILALKHRKR